MLFGKNIIIFPCIKDFRTVPAQADSKDQDVKTNSTTKTHRLFGSHFRSVLVLETLKILLDLELSTGAG